MAVSPEKHLMPSARSRGFTLLEVLVALAILTVSLMILVSAQSNAARMTAHADRLLVGTMLAKQKISELEIFLDLEQGFSEQDEIVEEGDFEEMLPGQFPEFRWRTTIRKLDLRGAGTGGLGGLFGAGSELEDETESAPGMPEQPDIASLINMEEVTEQLARFIREINVVVWWDFGGDHDQVSVTTHIIKPTGPQFYDPSQDQAMLDSIAGAGTTTGAGLGSLGSGSIGGIQR